MEPGLEPEPRRPSCSTTTPTCSTPRCCGCRRVGFITPHDPMWTSTLEAMDDELVTDSLVYRYDPEASPDGLRGSEGTFSLCTFAYVDALARAGRLDEARLTFEKMLTYANHLGPLLRGDRAHRRADRQLPAGVHAPGADRRGDHAGPAAGRRAADLHHRRPGRVGGANPGRAGRGGARSRDGGRGLIHVTRVASAPPGEGPTPAPRSAPTSRRRSRSDGCACEPPAGATSAGGRGTRPRT